MITKETKMPKKRSGSYIKLHEEDLNEIISRVVKKQFSEYVPPDLDKVCKQLENFEDRYGSLFSPSKVYKPNDLGLQIKMEATIDESAFPLPLRLDEAETIWPADAWPWLKRENGRAAESEFKKSLESIRLQGCTFSLGFSGDTYDDETGVNKNGDFYVHLKGKGMYPCYTAAIFSLYSGTAEKYNSKREMGEIAVRAMKLLRSAGPHRTGIIAGVTDGYQIEWCLLEFIEGDYKFTRTGEHNDVRESLCAFMCAPQTALYILRDVNLRVNRKFVIFSHFLGAGRTGTVYSCHYGERKVAAKCFFPQCDGRSDVEFLKKLQGIDGVPTFVGADADYKTILLSPVGQKLENVRLSKTLKPRLSCIVDVLKSVHERDVVHRDVRISNILQVDDGFQLIDWGFAANLKEPTLFSGNISTASDRLLDLLAVGHIVVDYLPADDLISLVRTLYRFSHRNVDKELAKLKENCLAVRNFWSTELEGCEPWIEAQNLAANTDYGNLKGWIQEWAINYWP